MALRQSDIQIHNNPNLAVVDSDFVKGGFRTAVGSVNDLYALSGKTDEPSAAGQVKEYATIVYVTGDSKYYVLKDVSNIANANGWEEFVAGGAGTVTGATNGLSLFNTGTTIGLGGAICTNTTILNPSYALSISGGSISSFGVIVQNPTIIPVMEQTSVCISSGLTYIFSNHSSTARYGTISINTSNVSGGNVMTLSAAGNNSTNGDIGLCGSSHGISLSGACTNFHTPIKLYTAPTGGSTNDSLLVWDSGDKFVKQIAVSAITSGITTNTLNIVDFTGVTYYATQSSDFIGASGGTTIFLPNPPKDGQRIVVADIGGNALMSPIKIDGNGKEILKSTDQATINTEFGSITFIYNSKGFWSTAAFIN